MAYENFTIETGADGIAVITWDMPARSMNVITMGVMDELDALIDAVAGDEAITGAIVTSGKTAFSGGADLTMLNGLFDAFHAARVKDPKVATKQLYERSRRLSLIYRKLETSGKPFVAAINGTCMGGAFELALACHGRIAAAGDYRMGLPEVKVGLFPGAGGTIRVMRMVEPQAALQMLLQGQALKPERARAMGLIDQVVASEALLETAKKALTDGVDPEKAWDKKDYRLTGAQKIYSPAGYQLWPAANALYRKETHDNYPGARGIMQAAFEGLQLPMDLALQVESRYFAKVLQSPQAGAMVRSLFVSMQELNKGARRPAGVADTELKKIGVLGAGFMGAGIAFVTAKAGIDVVLIDRDTETAAKGKAHSEDLVKKAVGKARMTQPDGEKLLAHIHPTADYADLADCDLIIEAVFEDRDVKAEVMAQAVAHLGASAIFASNTSTLPITSLAKLYKKPSDFIGIHFFSPVDRMMLVEVILGKKTKDKALAVALDYVRAIKKTPIVVNDSRGFYANRCVTAYLLEGHKMLSEGVPAAMIENAAKMAGMPVGPLSLNDEVGVDLGWKILKATEADLGQKAIDPGQKVLLEELVVRRQRLGRKNGKGFYDYEGRNKHLWPGLAEIAPPKPADHFSVEELQQRFLVVQALEAARTVAEGVVTDPREADVGSILGFGFAPWSGGTLSYIDTMGAAAFLDLAKKLARKHGPRFKPNKLLRDMAANGETFYGRFGQANGAAKRAA
jgi:3-hydroxyacyl-CoA dehydrogenase/enoyl-CoA hydratase/3-hydroxybutyryl-CoA epimerase